MNNLTEDYNNNNNNDQRYKKQGRGSQPSSRKSRSISRYFLGNKRSSIDIPTHDIDISHYLTSNGIFDSYDLWTNVILFHDYTTCRRLFILTTKNQLIIGKTNSKQSLFKIKYSIDLNRIWLSTNLNDSVTSDITSLTYYDFQRSLILGWPLAENFLVEFDTKTIRDQWYQRIQSALSFWWQITSANIEHVRVIIDQNYESDQNNNTTSFLIRKVISIRPQETVRDLIKKCIDAAHLRDSSVDNYILYVLNDTNGTSSMNNNTNQTTNSSMQLNQTQLIPLIGHEYPYAIKMKNFKTTNNNNTSFDNDDHVSLQSSSTLHSHQYSSSTSLNNISINSYDFQLRKRELDQSNKKHRFFHKRKTKDNHTKSLSQSQQQLSNDDNHSLTLIRTKSSSKFFGQTLDDLIQKSNNQLPNIIQQLLEILYFKGPETTGIFRKVANTRSVKESIEKIEKNIPLHDDDLYPILAAGIFKHFLRTLPEPVFDTTQYDNWKKCLRLPILQERISFARRSIIGTLSYANHLLLKGFICVLSNISQNADINGMNPFNLGLCVSNSLFKTESTTITSGKQEADVMSSIVEFLILNCSSIFGSDVITCIPDKHIIVHSIANLTRPNASSIESLDEVESSPHVPIVNRSRDSGLATSDQPFNDDSSEISEHFRSIQKSSLTPDWVSAIACGSGTVLTSIILPSNIRCKNLKTTYKPSKQFMEREKLTNDTTDESDHDNFNGDSSVRSSTTTVHNMTIGKPKRTKPISRHSSLGSNEHHQQQSLTKESKRSTSTAATTTVDVKRASSLKQFHHISDEADNDDEEQNKTITLSNNNNNVNIKKKIIKNEQILSSVPNERRSKLVKSKTKNLDEESMITRSTQHEQQDLDLTSEPLSTINQRLTNSSTLRSASFTITSKPKKIDSPFLTQTCLPPDTSIRHQPIINDGRSRHNGPLTATTNQIYNISRNEHPSQTNSNTQKTSIGRDRTFVHNSDSRTFKLGQAIQMKPIDDVSSVTSASSSTSPASNGRRRPCHRQNALRYKSIDPEQPERRSRQSTPITQNQNRIYSSNENSLGNISRYQSIERRLPPSSSSTSTTNSVSSSQPIKSFSFDINHELHPSDICWSVREKAKLFEHPNEQKLSTGRENYV